MEMLLVQIHFLGQIELVRLTLQLAYCHIIQHLATIPPPPPPPPPPHRGFRVHRPVSQNSVGNTEQGISSYSL